MGSLSPSTTGSVLVVGGIAGYKDGNDEDCEYMPLGDRAVRWIP